MANDSSILEETDSKFVMVVALPSAPRLVSFRQAAARSACKCDGHNDTLQSMLNMSSHFVLSTRLLLSASFLVVSCYNRMCLTTSAYGITVLLLHSAYLLPLLP